MRLDRPRGEAESLPDADVGPTLGHVPQDVELTWGEVGQLVRPTLLSDETGDDVLVDRRSSGTNPAQRVHERGDVIHPVLDQVADSVATAFEQPNRVGRL